MAISARSHLISGIAVIGVGAIAVAPIQPQVTNHVAPEKERALTTLGVELAASIDPITPWVETFQTAAANMEKINAFYWEKPFPIIQTIAKNQLTYLNELPDIGLIASQVTGNIKTFFEAPWSPGACDPCGEPPTYTGEYISDVPITNRIPILGKKSQRFIFGLLPTLFNFLDPELYPTIKPVLDFTGSHFSGQLAGGVGVLLSPIVQLGRSLSAIGQYIEADDLMGALNELINIPANATNALLNGAGYFDLTGIAGAIAPLPPEVESIGLNLGGFLTPPVPLTGTLEEPTSYNGGTLFDILATSANASGIKVITPGLPVGPLSAKIDLGQFLGEEMLVTPPAPPPPPAAATPAVPATPATPAIPAESPATPATPATPAVPASEDDSAVADEPAPAEAPAPRHSRGESAAGSANSGNENATRASSRGMDRSASARGAS